jgi:hypothetical protein
LIRLIIGVPHFYSSDFEKGYMFEAADGTLVFYTGLSIRLSTAYSDKKEFVTELTVTGAEVISVRHTVF